MALRELVPDRTQGVQLATMQELCRYWADGYDWRRCEARLNALPQFMTEIDGVDVHFIHVRSPHPGAMPLIITHGWPGSVMEMLEAVGPLTDPPAYGGSAEDAFDLVLPSIPGYGFSAEPTELGWDLDRMGRAWAELMRRLGYSRYVAQGGDVGAGVTDAMGRQAPEGLVGIHTNLLVTALGAPQSTDTDQERTAADAITTFRTTGIGYFTEHGNPAADHRLCPPGLPRRPRGLDARPRHRRVLQDRPRVRRRAALGQPHPRPRPRQRHAVLADRHGRLGGAVVLGALRSDAPAAAAAVGRTPPDVAVPVGFTTFPGEIWRTPRSWAESRLPRPSRTSTRWTGAATSPPGRSRSCSRREMRAAFRSLRRPAIPEPRR